MTYPPGSPNYSNTPPTTQFSTPTQQLSKVPETSSPAEPGKLPMYLAGAVAAFGLAVYLSSFGPQFTISNSEFPQLGSASGSTTGLGIAVVASILAALLAGVTVLPKPKNFVAVAAVTAVLAFLVVIAEVINAPSGATIDWALYLVIAFSHPAHRLPGLRPAPVLRLRRSGFAAAGSGFVATRSGFGTTIGAATAVG
jgi:hypothetical protein